MATGGIDDLNAKLAEMTMVQLRDELKKRRLKTTGLKNELILRLAAIMNVEREHGDPEQQIDKSECGNTCLKQRDASSSDSDSSDDEEDVPVGGRQNETRKSQKRQLLTFRDVEESIEAFSGDDKVDVTRWLRDFEEMAELCEWSDIYIQKVVYAKRLLRGSAKLFVNYERCTKTWRKLRRALKEEFKEAIDSHAVHRELSRRRKTSDESYQTYVYKMLEIAAQADVDTKSVIQYIIEGIQDEPVNKTVLHGAKTVRELKERLIQYEAMKKEGKSRQQKADEKQKKRTTRDTTTITPADARRCFNCGDKDHMSKECPTKNRSSKCFKCNQYGHIAKLCKSAKDVQKETALVISDSSRQKQSKQVEIANQCFVGIIDTGSDLSLMNRDCYEKIGCPELRNKIHFSGLGAPCNSILGSFTTNIVIDGETYEIMFHVIDSQVLKSVVLIGADFLNQVELHSVGGRGST